jgi:hypothetical protein
MTTELPVPEKGASMRWWEHPLLLVAWSILALVVYALFPSSDTNAVVALLVWGVGALAWMVAGDARRHWCE